MTNKTIHIGIASVSEQRRRALAIASGSRRRRADEPTLWFSSMRALANVLSDENMALLRILRDDQPESVLALAEILQRAPSNVSRSLSTLAQFGFVELIKQGRIVQPRAVADDYRIAVG